MSRHEAVARVQALKAFPGFRELSPEYLVALGNRARLVRLSPEDVLQTAGLVPSEVYIVLQGAVALSRRETRLATVEEYGLVGGPMSLSDLPATDDAIALTDVEAIVIDTQVARALIVDHVAIFAAVLSDLARGILRLRSAVGPHRGYSQHEPKPRASDVSVIARMRALVESPVFENAPIDVVGALAVGGRVQQHAVGELVVSSDEQPEHALFPIYGGARCVRDGCAAVLSSGSGVGFEAMLAHEAMGCTFRATCDSAFLRIQRDALFDDLEDDDDACVAVLVGLSNVARNVASQLSP